MDPDTEVEFDAMPFFRLYKSGRVERTDFIKLSPPSLDAATGVSSKDVTILQQPDVSARVYIPTAVANSSSSSQRLPLLVYFHGGGFTCGSAFSADLHAHLSSLVAGASVVAVSANYRLAPEHPIPAAYDDAWRALRWAVSHAGGAGAEAWLADRADFGRVFVAGESAGANIAHHVAMRAGADRVAGLLLIQPCFLQAEPTESDSFDAAMSSGLKETWRIACPSGTGLDDYRINPAGEGAPSLSGLGCERLLVCVAERDVLRDRGRDYYEKVKECGWGGEAELYETRGEGHVFHLVKPDCEEAQDLISKISSFINLGKEEE